MRGSGRWASSRNMPDFDVATLARYLRPRLPDADEALQVEGISGGQSNPTYWLKFSTATYVLRKQPPGPLLPSAHAVDREYRILTALTATEVPVPQPYLFCDDATVIGTPFYVMAALTGRVFADSALPGLTPADRAAIYDSMNATLARIHTVDWQALGLSDYGKAGNYFARQIARWTKQWRNSQTRAIPEIDSLVEWLPRHLPDDDVTTIAHGDYRLGNLIYHPTKPHVIGVVDWELSTLGHPLADLAYNCLLYHAAEHGGILGLDREALGIPSEAEYVARYCDRTGRASGLTPFHLAFALFRFAVILEGVAARAAHGNAAADNAREVGALSAVYAQRAWAIAQGTLL